MSDCVDVTSLPEALPVEIQGGNGYSHVDIHVRAGDNIGRGSHQISANLLIFCKEINKIKQICNVIPVHFHKYLENRTRQIRRQITLIRGLNTRY